MCDNSFTYFELKYLWKHRGDKSYNLKNLISNGTFIQYMVLEDKANHKKFLGKIVTAPGEGEAYHWPRLQHENLAPLISTVSINENISVYISPLIDKNLRSAIHAQEFMQDFACFDRKRAYTEDILWALDYLHSKSLCLMNLTELIIYVCEISDKAVICDFSHLFLIERATKEKFGLPVLYQAPELKTGHFDAASAEIWACGVMLLHIFTNHHLPTGFIGEEAQQVLKAVNEINCDLINEANPGAQIDLLMVEELKHFLDLFLNEDPKQRVNPCTAAMSSFLRCSRSTMKNDFNSKHFLRSYRANWEHSDFKNKDSETFKDIYLSEIAKYKANLKKLPSSNKFINLDFVPDGDNVLNNSDKNQENISAKHETMHSLELPAIQNSEEQIIGDNETMLYKNFDYTKNESFQELVDKINSLNLKLESNFKSEDEINNTEREVISLASTSIVDEIKCIESKSEADQSDILMESSENVNKKEQLIEQNTPMSNLSLQNDTLNEENKELLASVNDTTHYIKIKHAQSEIVVRNSNLRIESDTVRNLTHFLKSDPGADQLKSTKEDTVIYYLDTLSLFYIQCSENYSQRIIQRDKNETDISSDFRCEGYITEISQNEKQFTESSAPEIKCPELSITKSCDFGNTVNDIKQLNSLKHAAKPHLMTQFSDHDTFKTEKNNDSKISPTDKFANQLQVEYQCIRQDSYKQAIMQGLENKPKDETNKIKQENSVTTEGQKSAKIVFNNTILSSMEKDETKIICNSKKSEHILPIRDILTDEGTFAQSNLYSLETLEKPIDPSVKNKKHKRKMKRSWIYYLCPGSRPKTDF